MSREVLWTVAGLFDLALAGFHLTFWRLLGWREKLALSGRVNAAVTQTLNIVLIYVFAVYGLALISLAHDAGRGMPWMPAAGAGFWALRTVLQPILFAMHHPASIAITAAFVAGTVVHILAAMF